MEKKWSKIWKEFNNWCGKYGRGSVNNAIFWQIMCLIFVVAKIFNYITWSWWWVFAPIWGPFALVLGIIVLAAVVVLLFDKVIDPWYKQRRSK